jgi:predicted Zn-dependent protease with MMP-like domain
MHCVGRAKRHLEPMLPHEFRRPPGLAQFEILARAALEALPADVRAACARVAFRVAEVADDDVLDDLGIEDPLELTGLYVGAAIAADLGDAPPLQPPEVWLYREAILEEWFDRGDVDLRDLIAHVLIHEIGHHMGWDDDDIARIEGED